MIEVKEQCKGCYHFQVCANVLKQQLFIREALGEDNPSCEQFIPTADVVEVRHSKIKWANRPIPAQCATVIDEYGKEHYGMIHGLIKNNPVGYCEECGKRLDDTFMNFCPNCGAKMDGEKQAEACKNCVHCDEHHSAYEEYVEHKIDPTERIFEPPVEVSRQC